MSIHFPPHPAELSWVVEPVAWSLQDGILEASAGPKTDLFISPAKDARTLNAPRLLGPVSGDFTLAALVSVEFAATFDAGVLFVWENEQTWAKLCFEYSPEAKPMVVSVVTRGESDDANGFTVQDNKVWLRIARIGQTFAFHASLDGLVWSLIRHFRLEVGDAPLVGFVFQSPIGQGCQASFRQVRYTNQRLAELRDGS